MCYQFYQFVWISVYMLCNFGHCSSLCWILILMGSFWHLFSLCYLRSIFSLCVNICTVRCFSNYCWPHPHLSGCWSYEWAQHTAHRSWLDKEVGPWGNSPTPSSKWYGRDALQPQNRGVNGFVLLSVVLVCLQCVWCTYYEVILSSGTYH